MDVAVYRALTPVGGTVSGYVVDDDGTHALIKLSQDVSSLFSVRVGSTYSSSVSLLSLRMVKAQIPPALLSRPRNELEFRVFAQTRLAPGTPYLTALGFGHRVELADPVTDALQRAHRFLLKGAGTDPWDRSGGDLWRVASENAAEPDVVSRHLDLACDRFNSKMARAAARTGPVVTRLAPLEVRRISWQDAEVFLNRGSATSQVKTSTLDRATDPSSSVLLVRVENTLRGASGASIIQNALTV